MKGSVVLIHFPFTDLSAVKLRPALVIHESDQDVIVAFISSRIPGHLSDSDLLISPDHPSFSGTGLKRASVIKFDKVATVSRDLIEGGIGEIDKRLARECNAVMSRVFTV
jgi:mRNA interferase MazF